MKYTVIYRKDGTAEIHSTSCKEFGWDDFASDGVVEAEHQYGAAWAAWNHEDQPEAGVLEDTRFFPCLHADYVAGPPTPRKRVTRRNVPFDVVSDLDGEIIDACYGRRIVWHNRISGNEDTARLFPEGPRRQIIRNMEVSTFPHRHTTISVSRDGRRSLNFIDAGGYGFRSVALDAIVSVK